MFDVYLINNTVMCVHGNGVFGQAYCSRKQALDAYFGVCSKLSSKLGSNSCILK